MTIQLATKEMIPQLLYLNRKYQFDRLNIFEQQKGFIKIEYSENEFIKIIENHEIVVAPEEGKLVRGYYLIGKKSGSEKLIYQQKKAEFLAQQTTMTSNTDRIGDGCQVCIEENFRSGGLSRKMLDVLITAIKGKYDYLLSTISKENSVSLTNSTALGWTLFNSIETPQYYIYKL